MLNTVYLTAKQKKGGLSVAVGSDREKKIVDAVKDVSHAADADVLVAFSFDDEATAKEAEALLCQAVKSLSAAKRSFLGRA